MKCEEYKERVAAEPAFADQHVADCDSCSAYQLEVRALDRRITEALEIDLPELVMPELPAMSGDRNVVELPVRNRFAQAKWIGLAASVLLATVIGFVFFGEDTVYPSLGAEIIAHLDHEQGALRVADNAVSERRLAKVVRDDVAQLDAGVGLITYARTCVINGNKIPHLVIQGQRGPVTLLLLPDEKIDAAVTLEGESINGVILPVGDGSVAIVGERDEPIHEIEQRVINSVEWST